jgi:malate dehydrogenase (oxaloacetate-decarboxylating)(NADP+)
MDRLTSRAKTNPKRVVFAEADNYKILKAAQVVYNEGIGVPILLGNKDRIKEICDEFMLSMEGVKIIDPRDASNEQLRNEFADIFYDVRKRRGLTLFEARKMMRERNYFGSMMVRTGAADALISGLTRKYPATVKPALQVIGIRDGVSRVAGLYIIMTKNGPVFFSDTTVNINPTAEELVDITILTADAVSNLNIVPKIALLSYSNFGSAEGADAIKMREVAKILHQRRPDLIVDGELQANFAMNNNMLKEQFPF